MDGHLKFLGSEHNLGMAIQGHFDPVLVIISVVVASVAAYTAFLFSERIDSSEKHGQKLVWIITGSLTLGVGIWAMHFTGMIAYSLPFNVVYDKTITLISILPAVLAAAVIFIVGIFQLKYNWCMPVQSILLGSGIGCMHYVGMAAMRMDADMLYEPWLFAGSIIIAILLSHLALRFKIWGESTKEFSESSALVIAAVCMGIAISAMHYTGMAGVYYFPANTQHPPVAGSDVLVPADITNIVIYIVLAMLSLMIAAVHLSRRLELMKLLGASKTRQENIFTNMVDGLIVINSRGLIDSFNPSAEAMFGFQAKEIIGKNVNEIMTGHDKEHHDKYLQKYLQTQQSDVIGIGREILGRSKDGKIFPVEIALSRFEVEGEWYFTGVIRDISERKDAEKSIIEARRIAEVASHTKSEFLHRVSHELRTPMNAIIGFGDLLEADRDKFAEEHQAYIEQLKHASHRLLKLIDSMLDLSNIETHQLDVDIEPVILFDAIHASITALMAEAQEVKVTIQNLCSDHELIVMADVGRLQQVIHHLLSNAIKYSSSESPVTIGCESRLDNRIRILITDHGEGISLEKQAQLFKPFERLNNDERLKGVGMGLAISKHLVELMDGTIGVDSQPGVGSTFWIELEQVNYQQGVRGNESG